MMHWEAVFVITTILHLILPVSTRAFSAIPRKIENLNSYVALKALYLDSNGFCNIENISHLSNLRCLFLHKNFISRIENLQGLSSLVQLDLSENRITKIEGLSVLPNLATLNLARNHLTDGSSISHLKKCSPQLTTLNLSFNQLQGQEVLEQLIGIASIIVLDMKDNPILRDLPHFRKKCIVGIPKLRSLNSPIFEVERISAEAWAVGGSEAERKAKNDFQERQREKDKQNLQQFRLWKDNVRDKQQKGREQEALLGSSTEAADAEKKRVEQIRSARLQQASEDSEKEKAAFRIEDDCAETFPTTDDKSFEEAPLDRGSELVHGVEPLRLPNTETSSCLYLDDNAVETSDKDLMVVTPTSSDNNVTVEFNNKLNMHESDEEENDAMQSTIEESLILYKAVKLHGKPQESVYAARNTWDDGSYCDENKEVQIYKNQESEEMADITYVDTFLSDDFSKSTEVSYTDTTTTIIRHKVHTDRDGKQLTWEQMATLPPAGKLMSISAFVPGINDDDEEQDEGESVLSTDVIRKRLQPIPMSI